MRYKLNETGFVGLKRNDKGYYVTLLQRILNSKRNSDRNKLIEPPLVVDGLFGPLTEEALIKFQLHNNFCGSGVVDQMTSDLLAPTRSYSEVFGSPGRSNINIAIMQAQLKYLSPISTNDLIVSGIFDSNTEDALVEFQRYAGIEVTKILDDRTKVTLDNFIHHHSKLLVNFYDIPLLTQHSSENCWACSIAMLNIWKEGWDPDTGEQKAIDIMKNLAPDMIRSQGGVTVFTGYSNNWLWRQGQKAIEFRYGDNAINMIGVVGPELAGHFGFTYHPYREWKISEYHQALLHGPLFLWTLLNRDKFKRDVDQMPHAIVMSGLVSINGLEGHTYLLIQDPMPYAGLLSTPTGSNKGIKAFWSYEDFMDRYQVPTFAVITPL